MFYFHCTASCLFTFRDLVIINCLHPDSCSIFLGTETPDEDEEGLASKKRVAFHREACAESASYGLSNHRFIGYWLRMLYVTGLSAPTYVILPP